jgi:hypothetical protein
MVWKVLRVERHIKLLTVETEGEIHLLAAARAEAWRRISPALPVIRGREGKTSRPYI